jgi:hypothetical protein
VALSILVLVGVSLLDGGEELRELGLVLLLDLGESENGSGLSVVSNSSGLLRCS